MASNNYIYEIFTSFEKKFRNFGSKMVKFPIEKKSNFMGNFIIFDPKFRFFLKSGKNLVLIVE